VCHITEAVFSSFLDKFFLRCNFPSSCHMFCIQRFSKQNFVCISFFHSIHACLSGHSIFILISFLIFNLILMHFSSIFNSTEYKSCSSSLYIFFCIYFVYNIETFSQIWFSLTYYIVIVSGLCILCWKNENTKKNV
jgi:hypothetical protein